jgi:hypothetical protein
MEKVKTLTVDLYEPSDNEKILYVIEKSRPNNGIMTYFYSTSSKYKVYLNLFNRLESGIEYFNSDSTYSTKTIFIKDGKMELEDTIYYCTFDIIDAEEKLLEYKKIALEKRKKSSEEHYQAMYEEIKEKYSDKDWFK